MGEACCFKTRTNGDFIDLAARHSEFVRQLAKIDKLRGGCSVLKTCTDGSGFLASKFKKMTQKCGILKGLRGPKIGNLRTAFFAGSEVRFSKEIAKMCDLLGFL